MTIGKLINFVIAGLLLWGQVAIAATSEGAIIQETVQLLYSNNRKEAKKAEQELIAQHAALIRDLTESIKMHQVELGKINDPLRAGDILHGIEASINVLGEMRSVEAITVLTEMISFPQVVPDNIPKNARAAWDGYRQFRYSLWHAIETLEDDLDRHPAAKALVKIGEPCLPAVVEKLMVNQTFHPRLLVLVGVLGQEGAESLLSRRLDGTTDEKTRKPYEMALEYIRKGQIRPSKKQGDAGKTQ